MNWTWLRHFPWVDTRAAFVAATPQSSALVDFGSSVGETLCHFAELRPDLKLFAVDIEGQPERYPPACQFHRADLQRDRLPWPDASMDAATCLHLVEHLNDLTHFMREVARVLKPGGRIFFETPHPKSMILSSTSGPEAGVFPMNFFDDLSHIRPVTTGALAQHVRAAGLKVDATGISRNWLFAAAYPCFAFLPPSRKKFTARLHWLGWSAYLIARKLQ